MSSPMSPAADPHPERPQLDLLSSAGVVGLLLDAEARVVPAVRAQLGQVADAADLIAARLARGGRLLFAGAGTSGRLAVAEAAELPGTFGIDRDRVLARTAGGVGATDRCEDDLGLAEQDLAAFAITAPDALVTVAASGRTPYTLAVARSARQAGALVVVVVNAIGTPLAALADVAVEVEVGPEVLRDSTRMSAGTAQKVVLDALTTAAMVRLGRVHGDLMVDLAAANAKLRERAVGIVAEIAGCAPEVADRALRDCAGNARAAVLAVVLGAPAEDALRRAAEHRTLREALRAAGEPDHAG
jgi:N-acetylmuramic acid 6-phosphate etherase